MPLFALICDDKPGAGPIRAENRAAHLDYLRETGATLAGPFLDDAGGMTGSLVVIDVADRASAEAWAAADPYARAGMFSAVTIRPWKRVVG